MKNKFSLIMVLIGFISYSQSSNSQRDPQFQSDFEMELVPNNSSIVLSRYKTSTINEVTLQFKTETNYCNDYKVLLITLESGEKLKFDTALIDCDKVDAKKNILIAKLLLTEELYAKLSQTEIVDFEIGNVKIPVKYKERGENLKALFKFSE